ncbi:MAG: hypothetical protein EOO42_22525 [Flavobacteriales bacterium]|nr:MAG: hypothetical protein EOO42_22525 [Flavobacteriales bacterium]
MTIEKFDNTGFTGGMRVRYDGSEYDLVSVDFQEKLIAIDEFGQGHDATWKRCENVEVVYA